MRFQPDACFCLPRVRPGASQESTQVPTAIPTRPPVLPTQLVLPSEGTSSPLSSGPQHVGLVFFVGCLVVRFSS